MTDLLPGQIAIGDIIMGEATDYTVTDIDDGGKPDATLGDKEKPREDGIYFGRDRLNGRLITLEVSVDTDDETAARAAYAALTAAWNPEDLRRFPSQVTALRIRSGQAPTKVVYGRPRRCSPTNLKLLAVGRVDLVLDFRCADHLFYSDVEFNNSVSIVPSISGYLVPPIEPPLITINSTETSTQIVVEGDEGTLSWIVSEIEGPIINPEIEVPNQWRVRFDTELIEEQILRIDPQPWSRGIYLNDLPVSSGIITTDSPRLSSLRLPPGSHTVVIRGLDPTGTALLKNFWRNAYIVL